MQQPDQKTLASYELLEVIRTYGQVIGTPGMSEKNLFLANGIVEKCLDALEPYALEQIGRLKATVGTGLITK